MKEKKIDIFELGDLIDSVIVGMADKKPISSIVIQKGIFLYLLSYSRAHGYKFKDIASSVGFEPYKYGPFSDFVNGEIDTLQGYGDIFIERKANTNLIESNPESVEKYLLNGIDNKILENVKSLVEKLTTNELVFFVYFNPDIYEKQDGDIRKYFISNSEIKDKLEKEKGYFIKKLQEKSVIDQVTVLA